MLVTAVRVVSISSLVRSWSKPRVDRSVVAIAAARGRLFGALLLMSSYRGHGSAAAFSSTTPSGSPVPPPPRPHYRAGGRAGSLGYSSGNSMPAERPAGGRIAGKPKDLLMKRLAAGIIVSSCWRCQ